MKRKSPSCSSFLFLFLFSFSFLHSSLQTPSDEEQAEKIRDTLKGLNNIDFSGNDVNDRFCALYRDTDGKLKCDWSKYANSLGRLALSGGIYGAVLVLMLIVFSIIRCCGCCGNSVPSNGVFLPDYSFFPGYLPADILITRIFFIASTLIVIGMSVLMIYGTEKMVTGLDSSVSTTLAEANRISQQANDTVNALKRIRSISIPQATLNTAQKIATDISDYYRKANDIYSTVKTNDTTRKAVSGVAYSLFVVLLLVGLFSGLCTSPFLANFFKVVGMFLILLVWIYIAFVVVVGTGGSEACWDFDYSLKGPVAPTETFLVTFYDCSNNDFTQLYAQLVEKQKQAVNDFCLKVYPFVCRYSSATVKQVYCPREDCQNFNSSADIYTIRIQEGDTNKTVPVCASSCQDDRAKNISVSLTYYASDLDTFNNIILVNVRPYLGCVWQQNIVRKIYPTTCVDAMVGVGYSIAGAFIGALFLLLAVLTAFVAVKRFNPDFIFGVNSIELISVPPK